MLKREQKYVKNILIHCKLLYIEKQKKIIQIGNREISKSEVEELNVAFYFLFIFCFLFF